MFRLAVSQFKPVFADAYANSVQIAEQLLEISRRGLDIVVYPEAALTGYCFASAQDARSAAISAGSAEMARIGKVCHEKRLHVIVGFAEADGGDLYNSAAFIGPDGLLGVYRKTHIPCLGLDRFVKAGDALPVYQTPFGSIGILICFDIRFPEPARSMALRGADLICLPTNWPESAEPASEVVCPARSMENHVFIAASNRVGHEEGFRFIGRSKILGPGDKLLAATNHDEPDVLFAEVDLSLARNKRIVKLAGEYEMDLWESRRPDLYGEPSAKEALR